MHTTMHTSSMPSPSGRHVVLPAPSKASVSSYARSRTLMLLLGHRCKPSPARRHALMSLATGPELMAHLHALSALPCPALLCSTPFSAAPSSFLPARPPVLSVCALLYRRTAQRTHARCSQLPSSRTTHCTHAHPSPNRNTPLADQSGHSPCKATPPLTRSKATLVWRSFVLSARHTTTPTCTR
jgi:hypothetical protein